MTKVRDIKGTIVCDQPNEAIDHWEGHLRLGTEEKLINCSVKNLLIRGSFVRNTKWVIGIAVYTG